MKCAIYEGLVNACSLSFASVVCCIVRVFVTSHDYAWGHSILQQLIKAILQLLFIWRLRKAGIPLFHGRTIVVETRDVRAMKRVSFRYNYLNWGFFSLS